MNAARIRLAKRCRIVRRSETLVLSVAKRLHPCAADDGRRRTLRLIVTAIAIAGCTTGGCGRAEPKHKSTAARVDEAARERDPAVRARKLIQLGGEQADSQDFSGATATLELATSAADLVEQPDRRAILFSSLAQAYVRAEERLTAGGALAKAAQAAAAVADPAAQAEALVAVAKAQSAAGSPDAKQSLATALAGTEKIADPAARAGAQMEIAAGYEQAKAPADATAAIETALASADAASDAPGQCLALAAVAAALQAMGRTSEASASFERAQHVAEAIATPSAKAHALSELGAALAAAGQKDRAGPVFSAAEQAAAQIPERDLRQQAQAAIQRHRSGR